MSFQPDDYQIKSLKTWYPPDHELHHDMLHPALGLSGEAGELLDLYKKHKFKPGFDWTDCKHCGKADYIYHTGFDNWCRDCNYTTRYTSLILDELGDWWYCARILAYQSKLSILEILKVAKNSQWKLDVSLMINCLSSMNYNSARIFDDYLVDKFVDKTSLRIAIYDFLDVLHLLNLVTIDELTDLNYQKLNSEPTNHGWKDAGNEDELEAGQVGSQ